MKSLVVFSLLNLLFAAKALAAEGSLIELDMLVNCPRLLTSGHNLQESLPLKKVTFEMAESFGGNPQFIIRDDATIITNTVTNIILFVTNRVPLALGGHSLETGLTAESAKVNQLIRDAVLKALNFAQKKDPTENQLILFNEDYFNGREVKTTVIMRRLADNKIIIEVNSAYSGLYNRSALSELLPEAELLPTGKFVEVPGNLFADQSLSLEPVFNFFKNLFDLTTRLNNSPQNREFEYIKQVETKRLMKEALYQFYAETVHQQAHAIGTDLDPKISHRILSVLKSEDSSYDDLPLATVMDLKALVSKMIGGHDKSSANKMKQAFLQAIDKSVIIVQRKELRSIYTAISLPISDSQGKVILIKLQFYYSAHVATNGTIFLRLNPYTVERGFQAPVVRANTFYLTVNPDTSEFELAPTQAQVDQVSQNLKTILETVYDRKVGP